jgi:hypothetical protein
MIGILALSLALLALALSSLGVMAIMASRQNRRHYEELAERIDVDVRLAYLTTQTLGAMRDVTRDSARDNRSS